MAGGFKRSGRFELIGVFVVAAIVVVIATTTGQGEANPKTTMALIFGVIAVFCLVLFALQRADLNRVSGADLRGTARAAGSPTSGSPSDSPGLEMDRAAAFETRSPGVSVAFGSSRAHLRHPRHPLKAASFRT